MTIKGVTCQDIAFKLLLPPRTIQGHLHQALLILGLSRVEDLSYDVIEAHHARTLQTETGRWIQPKTADPVSTDQSLNSLVALDELSASAPDGNPGSDHLLRCPTGIVEHYFESPDLHWSDELYRIHGYERGDIVPTLDLGISHFEQADRSAARTLWETLLSLGGPVSGYFTLRDSKGKARKVLISGDYIYADGDEFDGDPVGVWALVVDLTRSVYLDMQELIHEAVAASTVNRSVIEQAKGILMGLGGLSAGEAYEHISERSQDSNHKVVAISQEIIDRARQLSVTNHARTRADTLLDFVYPPAAD